MIPKLPLKALHIYGFVSLMVFLCVQFLKLCSISAPNWIFNHLNDFLVIPMVAIVGLHGVWFIKKDNSIRLSSFTTLSLVVLFSFVFEYYLPKQSYRYTRDIWDVLCYFSGGAMFYFLQKIE